MNPKKDPLRGLWVGVFVGDVKAIFTFNARRGVFWVFLFCIGWLSFWA